MATTIASCIYNASAGYSLSAGEEAKYQQAASSTAYTSFATWEAGRGRNLVTADEVEVCDIIGSGGWTGAADSSAARIEGFVSDGTRYIHIKTIDGARNSYTDGKFDNDAYILFQTDTYGIRVRDNDENILIDGMQVKVQGSTGSRYILDLYLFAKVEFKNCYFYEDSSVGQYIGRIYGTGSVYFWNCIFHGNNSTTIYGMRASSTTYIVNSLVTRCNNIGVFDEGSSITSNNNVVFWNTDDFSGANIGIDYCASDDDDGTNSQNLNENAGSEWDNSFVDHTTFDFRPKAALASCLLYNNGTPLTGTYTDLSGVDPLTSDITGYSRTGTWEIGPFQYTDAAGTTYFGTIYHHFSTMRQ